MGDLGTRIGERIADLAARATLSAKERATAHSVRTFMHGQEEFFRLVGGEVSRTIGPLWQQLAEHPDAPAWFKDTAGFVAAGKGQWAALLAGTATGAVMSGGLGDMITNELLPVTGGVISTNPHRLFSIGDAAALAARGIIPFDMAANDALFQGLNTNRFRSLVDAQSQMLTAEEILALVNRGIINEDFAATLFHRSGYTHDTQQFLFQLRHVPLTAEQVAAMWTRSILTTDEGAAIAAQNGTSREDFLRLTELAGQPPAPELLYAAFRRGIIDEQRLQRGIVQGPIRNEWFGMLAQLQYHSMTPEQSAAAVTQGHMSVEEGQRRAKEYGLMPEDFVTLIETSGLPPGIEFASEAFNRGFITDDDFATMFLESRIKNRYLPLLRQMRINLLPRETATSLLAKGVITAQRCATILAGHGLAQEDIEASINGALVEKGAASRDLTLSQTLALYEEQEITPGTAHDLLSALGYDDGEIELLLLMTDSKRERTFRNAIIARVRSGVVAGLTSASDAALALDSLGIPPARRDELLALWAIEQTTITRNLTPAQIVTAAKKSPDLMPFGDAMTRLIGQGYAEMDARILLSNSGITG